VFINFFGVFLINTNYISYPRTAKNNGGVFMAAFKSKGALPEPIYPNWPEPYNPELPEPIYPNWPEPIDPIGLEPIYPNWPEPIDPIPEPLPPVGGPEPIDPIPEPLPPVGGPEPIDPIPEPLPPVGGPEPIDPIPGAGFELTPDDGFVLTFDPETGGAVCGGPLAPVAQLPVDGGFILTYDPETGGVVCGGAPLAPIDEIGPIKVALVGELELAADSFAF